jgi:RNA polymerase sigma factor (sigma-70 family)
MSDVAKPTPLPDDRRRQLLELHQVLSGANHLRSMCRSADDFDDLVQDSLLYLHEKSIFEREDIHNKAGYAIRVLRSRIRDEYRRPHYRRCQAFSIELEDLRSDLIEEFDHHEFASEAADRIEQQAELHAMIDKLKPERYRIIIRGILEGKTDRELAEELGLSARAFCKVKSRAIWQVKRIYARENRNHPN